MLKSELIILGEYLYGEKWQSSLAKDLAIGTRTIRHWLSGGYINPRIEQEICQLVRSKYKDFDNIKEILIKYE